MTVYVDTLRACLPRPGWRWRSSCHLAADTEEELHRFAARIGLRRKWFQRKPRTLAHYDLTEARRIRAVKAGAVESIPDVVRLIREARKREEPTDA